MSRQIKTFHTPRLQHNQSGNAGWRGRVFDPGKNELRDVWLFPRRDRRAKDPTTETDLSLVDAWERIRRGKVPTKRHAILRARQLHEEWKEDATRSTTLSVGELAALEKEHPGRSKVRRTSTMNCVRRTLDRFVEFMDREYPKIIASEVQGAHIENYLRFRKTEGARRVRTTREGNLVEQTGRSVSDTTLHREYAYIRRMFQLGVERGHLASNPCTRVRRPSARSLSEEREAVREYSLSDAEVARLLSSCRAAVRREIAASKGEHAVTVVREAQAPAYLYPLVMTLAKTGCRLGELIQSRVKDLKSGAVELEDGLTWNRVDFECSRIRVIGKTGPRAVPIDEETRNALLAIKPKSPGPTDHVFCSQPGRPLRAPQSAFRAAVARSNLGKHVRIHDLRHTCLTRLSKLNVPPAIVQKLAGHTTPTMTAKYVNIDDDAMVAEVLKAQSAAGPLDR